MSAAMIGDRTAQPRALNDVYAVAPDPDDEDAFARDDLGTLAHRADPGRHAACDEAGEIERDFAINYADRRLIDHRALGERPDHAESSNVAAYDVTPAERAVELGALSDPRALGA